MWIYSFFWTAREYIIQSITNKSSVGTAPQDGGALLEYSIRQFIWRAVIHPALYLQETFHTLIELSSICCICFNALCLLYVLEQSHKDG